MKLNEFQKNVLREEHVPDLKLSLDYLNFLQKVTFFKDDQEKLVALGAPDKVAGIIYDIFNKQRRHYGRERSNFLNSYHEISKNEDLKQWFIKLIRSYESNHPDNSGDEKFNLNDLYRVQQLFDSPKIYHELIKSGIDKDDAFAVVAYDAMDKYKDLAEYVGIFHKRFGTDPDKLSDIKKSEKIFVDWMKSKI